MHAGLEIRSHLLSLQPLRDKTLPPPVMSSETLWFVYISLVLSIIGSYFLGNIV